VDKLVKEAINSAPTDHDDKNSDLFLEALKSLVIVKK
jgi:hypothetical protein